MSCCALHVHGGLGPSPCWCHWRPTCTACRLPYAHLRNTDTAPEHHSFHATPRAATHTAPLPTEAYPTAPRPVAAQVGEPVRPQRWSEVCAVAELVHLKLLMLGVHQGRLEDAVAQVREHLAHFGRPAGALNWG